MTVLALQAAKFLCKKSKWRYSNLELQKLIYIAHVFHVGVEQQPLVFGDFEAWKYGPVHPELYRYLRFFVADPIPESYPVFSYVEDISEGTAQIWLQDAFETFPPGPKIGPHLVGLTHREKSAWNRHYVPDRNEVIPLSSIADEYQDIYA